MKITGRNIKRRLYGVKSLTNRLSRAKYFRGHGVHSPFVYAIVRRVFMQSRFITDDRSVYDALCNRGVPESRAMQLQNLYSHCCYERFDLNAVAEGDDFVVLTREIPNESLKGYAAEAERIRATLVVMAPYDGRERETVCGEIIAAHHGTTVDNRGYLLIFNNYLPKQHFRL